MTKNEREFDGRKRKKKKKKLCWATDRVVSIAWFCVQISQRLLSFHKAISAIVKICIRYIHAYSENAISESENISRQNSKYVG